MAHQKLAVVRQGSSSVDELIQEFELQGPLSGLGDVGLVDRFKQVLNPRLQESIYHLHPMPETWAKWKQKASILDNQWRHFQVSQARSNTPRPMANLFTPPQRSPFHTRPARPTNGCRPHKGTMPRP